MSTASVAAPSNAEIAAIRPRSLKPRLRRVIVVVPPWAWALVAYFAVSLATIGRYALMHPAKICACVGTQDPAAYMWALSWWPHAIAHGINPFVTHYLWSPTGVNVAQGAMIPTAAIAVAPLTELAGPIVSYNVLTIAGPVLAAFTAYRFCRRLVGRELPSIVGGYLFGFSSYLIAQSQGHLNLSLVFLLPLVAHVALRRAWGEIGRAGYIVAMALLLVLQAGLSTELLAEAVFFGAVALLTARFASGHRARVDRLALETVLAGLLAIVLASPLLYYALFSGAFPHGTPGLSDVYGLDLLNPLFPTYVTRLGRGYFLALGQTFNGGNVTEAGGYVGAALLLAFVIWVVRERRTAIGKIVLAVAGVGFVSALGSHLHVAGIQTIPLPFGWIRHAPVVDNIAPVRIVVFLGLAIAVGISHWLAGARRGAIGRWLLVALGIALTFPNVIKPLYGVAPRRPKFFSTKLYRRFIDRGATVLVLPYGQNDISMLWQAEAGFDFYMPEGYVSGAVPAPFAGDPTVGLMMEDVPPPSPALAAFISSHKVTDVAIDEPLAGPWPQALNALGLRGQRVGGVLLYRVRHNGRS